MLIYFIATETGRSEHQVLDETTELGLLEWAAFFKIKAELENPKGRK